MNEEEEATARSAADVLRIVSANISGDDELLKLVLIQYRPEGITHSPEIQDLVVTSLSLVSYLVEEQARITGTTSEVVIDRLLLELS